MAQIPGVWDLTRWDESTWSMKSVPYDPILANYSQLVQAVIDVIRDDDVQEDRAKIFIRQAHDKIQRDLLDDRYGGMVPRYMMARGTALTNDDSSITVPADYLVARDVQINGAPSRYVSQEKIPASSPGFGNSEVVLDYYRRILQLNDANPYNWLLLTASDVYLYGAALFYVPWAQEPEKQQMWTSYYTDALRGVKELNGPQPRGGFTAMRGRPYFSVYTVIGDALLFGANQDVR